MVCRKYEELTMIRKNKRRNELTGDDEQTKEETRRIRRKLNGDEKTNRQRI